MDRPLLDIKNVTKTYGKSRQTVTALRDVNLTVPAQPARIVTIAGESGSGKTTLANAVLGFVTLTSGQILFEGQDVARLQGHGLLEYRRKVQAVFQDPFGVYNPFYPVRHVFDVVIKRFALARTRGEARDLVEDALNRVGLRGAEVLDKHPHQLSGGQRQRIMIARAYLLKPRLIVADEPVSMVDASLRAMILDIMMRLRDEQGISFLYITHDLSTAYQVGDDICILYRGAVVEQGNAQRVIEDPQHEYSRLLISSIPVPDPIVTWDTSVVLPVEEEA
jgi:ABC-type oligopeptide transport system ATPase subunit